MGRVQSLSSIVYAPLPASATSRVEVVSDCGFLFSATDLWGDVKSGAKVSARLWGSSGASCNGHGPRRCAPEPRRAEVSQDIFDRDLATECGQIARLGLSPHCLERLAFLAAGRLTLLSPEFACLFQFSIAFGKDHRLQLQELVGRSDVAVSSHRDAVYRGTLVPGRPARLSRPCGSPGGSGGQTRRRAACGFDHQWRDCFRVSIVREIAVVG